MTKEYKEIKEKFNVLEVWVKGNGRNYLMQVANQADASAASTALFRLLETEQNSEYLTVAADTDVSEMLVFGYQPIENEL